MDILPDRIHWTTNATLGKAASRWHKLTVASFFAWIASFMGATFMLGDEYLALGSTLAYALAGLSVVLSVLAMCTYWRFLRSCDELQQRIQLTGLAFGFGSGLVFMMGYRLLERMGFPAGDINDPVLVMAVCYVFGVALSTRKYR